MKIIVTNLFATSLSLFIAKMLASAWFFIVFNYTWSSLLFFVSRDRADASPSAPKTLPEKCEEGISDKKKERWGMRSEEVNLELELKSRQMMMMILPWWTSFFLLLQLRQIRAFYELLAVVRPRPKCGPRELMTNNSINLTWHLTCVLARARQADQQ